MYTMKTTFNYINIYILHHIGIQYKLLEYNISQEKFRFPESLRQPIAIRFCRWVSADKQKHGFDKEYASIRLMKDVYPVYMT